ncbi:MAG: tRNA (adenosine(37)-N6)-threonylcarbamoyltransferase complex ATPase subunit type 1 TsaE [Gemmatimonas sp.]|nr:tRNA (adenosine(37)-N6)-threonylcarbamoyltransferase complex ATPase subunit type 1 TsaE [Gemmatimonas sp.]
MAVAELSLDELQAWGRRFGASLTPPAVITLTGDLGAGKTTLVQAIAAGLGVTDEVTSPTYGIAHRYASARGPVWHFDLYRLRRPEELAQVGWDDAIASDGVVLVEWPEIAARLMPSRHVAIRLEQVEGAEARRRLHWPEASV